MIVHITIIVVMITCLAMATAEGVLVDRRQGGRLGRPIINIMFTIIIIMIITNIYIYIYIYIERERDRYRYRYRYVTTYY